MTGFAADADLGPLRCETIGLRIVVLPNAGRMAFGAHEVPVLVQPGPVQHVVVPDAFVRIEMKPALAAFVLRPRVPGDRQRLQAPVGEFDQILLQRIDAEGVLRLERRQLAVRPVRLDHELAVLPEEPRLHAEMLEPRIVEIAEHGRLGRVGHGVAVLGFAPELRLARVATGAAFAADEVRRRGSVTGSANSRSEIPASRKARASPAMSQIDCHRELADITQHYSDFFVGATASRLSPNVRVGAP